MPLDLADAPRSPPAAAGDGTPRDGRLELRERPDPAAWPAADAESFDEIARTIARLGARLDAAEAEGRRPAAAAPAARTPPAAAPSVSEPSVAAHLRRLARSFEAIDARLAQSDVGRAAKRHPAAPRAVTAATAAQAPPQPAALHHRADPADVPPAPGVAAQPPLAREIRALVGSVEALGRATAAGTEALRADLAAFTGEMRTSLARTGPSGEPAATNPARRALAVDTAVVEGLSRDITALRQQLRRARLRRPPPLAASPAPAVDAAAAPPAPTEGIAAPPAAAVTPPVAAVPATAAAPAAETTTDAAPPAAGVHRAEPAAATTDPLTVLAERIDRLTARIDDLARPTGAPETVGAALPVCADRAGAREIPPAAGPPTEAPAAPVASVASRSAAAREPEIHATPTEAAAADGPASAAAAPAASAEPVRAAAAAAADTAGPGGGEAATSGAAAEAASAARAIAGELAALVRAEIAAGTERLAAEIARTEPRGGPARRADAAPEDDPVARGLAGLDGRLAGIETALAALGRSLPAAGPPAAVAPQPAAPTPTGPPRARPGEETEAADAAPCPSLSARPRHIGGVIHSATPSPSRSGPAVTPVPATDLPASAPDPADRWTASLAPLSQRIRDEIDRLRDGEPPAAARGDAEAAAPIGAGDAAPANHAARLIAAARRAAPPVEAPDAGIAGTAAPSDGPPAVAASVAADRPAAPAAAPRTRARPRTAQIPSPRDSRAAVVRRSLILAAAALALAAGSWGILSTPFRALVSYWQETVGEIERDVAAGRSEDPATTAALPAGRSGAAPFTVTEDDLGAAPRQVDPRQLGPAPAAAFHEAAALLDRAGGAQAGTAAELLIGAARAGLPQAQFRLATLYERGTGVPQSRAEAIAWYERAAERGHVKAMHNLAVLVSDGPEGARDYAKAAGWFRKAAERGLVDSQFNLAILYTRGLGVKRDAVAAYRWFAIAALAGDREAERRRAELAHDEVPEKLRLEAERQAAAWAALAADPLVNDERRADGAPLVPPGGA